jgi:hypothetical protein
VDKGEHVTSVFTVLETESDEGGPDDEKPATEEGQDG